MMWKIILFIVPLSSFVTANLNQTEIQNNNKRRVDATELMLIVIDICVDFSDVGTEPDDIHFYIDGWNTEITLTGEIPSNFVKGRPLKIFSHGFRSNSGVFKEAHNAYQNEAQDFNVIRVDWEVLAGNILYCTPAIMTKRVGHNIALLVKRLIDEGYVAASQVHVIGHSLGAHVSGWAGKHFQTLGLGKLGRITGLDPAYPGFRSGERDRLSKNDADLVDIIHTNGKNSDKYTQNDMFHLGITDAIGHYDFYPNGGFNQPGCTGVTCSHSRAPELFFETISSKTAFYAKKCGSYDAFIGKDLVGCGVEEFNYMGENLHQSTSQGSYFLCTKKSSPFDKGASEGLQCRPTICDTYKSQQSTRSPNNIAGLHMELESIVYDENIFPNEKEFIGIEEIKNDSPATVRHMVTQTKETWEEYEMTAEKYWGVVGKFCAQHNWGGTPHCVNVANFCNNRANLHVKSSKQSQFQLSREVIVPPYTRLHVCSTISISADTEFGFTAVGRYTAEGLWAAEIARILARDNIFGVLDEAGDAVLVDVSGSIKLSLALEPQFMVSEMDGAGQSGCTFTADLIRQAKLVKGRNRGEFEKIMIQINSLINGVTKK